MKRTIVFLLAVLMLALIGCGQQGAAPSAPADNDDKTQASEPAQTSEPAKSGGKVVDYKVDIPDGLEETELEGVTTCWYNADGSNINLNITEASNSLAFSAITADIMRTTLIASFKDAYDIEPAITDRYFTRNDVSGFPAYQYCYDIDLDGAAMSQIIVCVNADQTYTFTYTAGSPDWMEVFQASADGIQLITE